MGSKDIARAVPAIMTLLVLILLSSGGAGAENCGVLISDAPMCQAPNADACETWCYHKGYSTGACYAGVNRRECICENPCSEEAQGERPPPSSAELEPTRA
ncbi:hypothetical protein C2845_PM11G16380 [Panicum miliaceum]|uniref:Knottin scorpion toxin-like domain-containing protein n=1 Tax=Panicum miliaceum TaxID=4540 RepID=A0A3L6RU37_PANMI|nr:hypothetical protein C2845_PM11G16380 [Panicum miliaceum]